MKCDYTVWHAVRNDYYCTYLLGKYYYTLFNNIKVKIPLLSLMNKHLSIRVTHIRRIY